MNTLRTLFLILGFILSFSINSIGQTTLIDSLQQLLQQKKITKEEKASICYQLAVQYIYVNPSKTMEYAIQSLASMPKDDYRKRGMIYNVLSAAAMEKTDMQRTILLLDSALYFFEKSKSMEDVGAVYINKGGAYYYLNQYQKAADNFYNGLEVFDSLGLEGPQANALNGLISVNIFLKEYDKGLQNAQKAIKLYEAQHDLVGIAQVEFNIGSIYFHLHQWEKAITYFDKVIPFYEEHDYKGQLARCYIQKAAILEKQDHVEEALKIIEKAVELKDYLDSKLVLIELDIAQANLYFELGNYSKSINLYQNAIDSAKVTKSYNYQQEALFDLITVYLKMDDYKNAYKFTLEFNALKDTVLAQNSQAKIKELEVKYETEKTTLDNILLAKERDFQKLEATKSKQLFYITLVVLLLLLVLSFLLIRQYKANANHLTSQLKFQLLRNQMNPHFLFNALVAIQSFVYENKPLEAGDYLSSFATLMRAILDNSMQEYISTEKELEWLENYLSLQLLRFDNRFEYSITVDKNISLKDTLIPPMLIQPFVENALEHGLKNLEHKGKIEVRLHLVNGQLQIDVQDNGVGFDANHKTKKNHLSHALNITKERLAFLNKKLTNKIFFEIQSEVQKGTLISFAIPFRNEK